MISRSPSLLSALVMGALAIACSSSTPNTTPPDSGFDAGPDAGRDGGLDAGQDGGPDGGLDAGYPYDDTTQIGAVCHAATPWVAGEPIYEEVTFDAGLGGVQGTLFSAVDLDNDGWTDLVVRYFTELELPNDVNSHVSNDSAQVDAGHREIWILHNNQHGGFDDVTVSSGLLQNRNPASDARFGRPGSVWAFGDLNNDGFLDAYDGYDSTRAAGMLGVGSGYTGLPSPAETSEILLNNGDGTFRLGPAGTVTLPDGGIDTPSGASFVDFDRDGNLDLWVSEAAVPTFSDAGAELNQTPVDNHLWKGDGTGHFTDVTQAMGLATLPWDLVSDLNAGLSYTWGWGTNACDLNNDGWPELLANCYARAPNHLFANTGPQTTLPVFRNVSVASNYAHDANMNWWNDQSARCWCKLHPGESDCFYALPDGGGTVPVPDPVSDWTCTGPSGYFRWDNDFGRDAFESGGNYESTQCVDIDNDGQLDLVTGADAHWDVGDGSDRAEILFNAGIPAPGVQFNRPGNAATGLVRTYAFQGWNESTLSVSPVDFDGDGWVDLFWSNSEYYGDVDWMFHQDSPRKFSQVLPGDGIAINRAAGSAIGDFFHDGRQGLVVGSSLMRCDPSGLPPGMDDCPHTAQIHLFRNVYQGYGNWIELALTGGAGSNRLAIGARVTVAAGGITQTREVGGGAGRYGYQDDLVVHVAVGSACDAVVTVRWPDAALTTQTFKLPVGHRFAVTEGGKPAAVF